MHGITNRFLNMIQDIKRGVEDNIRYRENDFQEQRRKTTSTTLRQLRIIRDELEQAYINIVTKLEK